jgi:transcriptional regulator with XRE-family HTH domain
MDTNSLFSERLKYLQKCLKIKTGRSFAKKIGITHANYQSYLDGSQPSLNKLVDILTNVEDLNPNWLICGKGEVFISGKDEEDISADTSSLDESPVPVSKTEYFEMKKQISDLIVTNKNLSSTNKNLSEMISKKSTAGSA